MQWHLRKENEVVLSYRWQFQDGTTLPRDEGCPKEERLLGCLPLLPLTKRTGEGPKPHPHDSTLGERLLKGNV